MKVKVVRESVRELQEKFCKTPLDYPEEGSLIAELQNILREKGKKITVSAKYKNFENEDYSKKYTKYKEKYLERICKRDRIHNVQIRVNVLKQNQNKSGRKSRLLDLAVLREDDTEMKLIEGVKYFTPQSVEHAIEVKYIQDKNIPSKNLMDKSFKKDFKKFKGLGEPKSRHLVIFSNKNIFQLEEKDEESTTIARERFGNLENEFKKENVIVEECYPEKEIGKIVDSEPQNE